MSQPVGHAKTYWNRQIDKPSISQDPTSPTLTKSPIALRTISGEIMKASTRDFKVGATDDLVNRRILTVKEVIPFSLLCEYTLMTSRFFFGSTLGERSIVVHSQTFDSLMLHSPMKWFRASKYSIFARLRSSSSCRAVNYINDRC